MLYPPLAGIGKAWQSLLSIIPFFLNQKCGGSENLPPLVLLSVRPLCASLVGQDRVGPGSSKSSSWTALGQPSISSSHPRGPVPSPLRQMKQELGSNQSSSAFILGTLEFCVRYSFKTWKRRFAGNDRYKPTGPGGSGSSALTSTILLTAFGGFFCFLESQLFGLAG